MASYKQKRLPLLFETPTASEKLKRHTQNTGSLEVDTTPIFHLINKINWSGMAKQFGLVHKNVCV